MCNLRTFLLALDPEYSYVGIFTLYVYLFQSETLHKRIENVGTTTTVKELVEIAAALKQEVKGGRCGRQRGGGAGHALRLRNDIVRELKGKKIKRKTAGRPRKYLGMSVL